MQFSGNPVATATWPGSLDRPDSQQMRATTRHLTMDRINVRVLLVFAFPRCDPFRPSVGLSGLAFTQESV